MMPGARVFVTGGGGFIGAQMVAQLAAAGFDVHAPRRTDLDLRDSAAVQTAIAAYRPAAIVHLASAGVATPGSTDESLIAAEVAMVDAVLRAAPVGTRLLHAGSMAEYGRARSFPEQPHTVYGRAKLAATKQVLAVARERELVASVARIFGAYGPGESPGRLFPTLIAAAAATGPIALSDGMQRRDMVQVGDVCAALLALLPMRDAPPILDIGTGQPVLLRDAILRVATELGIDPARLDFGAIARRATDADCIAADTAPLIRAIGWCPPQRFADAAPILPLLTGPEPLAAGLNPQ